MVTVVCINFLFETLIKKEAVMHFVGIMGTGFAVVLVQRVTVRPHFIVLRCIAVADKLWRL